jgi:hypothetical protein
LIDKDKEYKKNININIIFIYSWVSQHLRIKGFYDRVLIHNCKNNKNHPNRSIYSRVKKEMEVNKIIKHQETFADTSYTLIAEKNASKAVFVHNKIKISNFVSFKVFSVTDFYLTYMDF